MSTITLAEQDYIKRRIDLEIKNTHLRRQFLKQPHLAINNKEPLYLMAKECFFNEYIWETQRAERERCSKLEKQITSGKINTPQQLEIAILTLSCYKRLTGRVANIALKIENMISNVNYTNFLQHTVKELQEEAHIKGTIGTFGTVSNDISLKVQNQYEENPYPRWSYFEQSFPENLIDRRPLNILVAGCGTGKQLYGMEKIFPNSRITAIDLSKASLSYAVKKLTPLGFKDIRFLQGDLLEIATLGQTYDLIFTTGVLHHMQDPKAGWRALADVLKTGGYITIALYSKIARKELTDCRTEYIEDKNVRYSIEGLKKVRQQIKDLPLDHPYSLIKISDDFYATSECRDLLFHVQEHQHTLPDIKSTIAELGLTFDQFMGLNQYMQPFYQKHPDTNDQKNLDLWHDFEQENPRTFAGMYLFRCQKNQ